MASDYLAVVLKPYYERICEAGIAGIYSTFDMRTGIDMNLLPKWEDMLCSLVKLDPRGGYFCNTHVADALLKLEQHKRMCMGCNSNEEPDATL